MKTLALIAALLLASAAAMAAVTFDTGTGTGSVGLTDVPWDVTDGVYFSYESNTTYHATCLLSDGSVALREPVYTSGVGVNSALRTGARHWSGWALTGYGASYTSGTKPVYDQPCTGDAGEPGVWREVGVSSTVGGLYATRRFEHVLIQ